MNLNDRVNGSEWTLFLDRDGVINRRIVGDYIREWDQFEFLPGVLDSLKVLSGRFGKILVVSNQQGIGKGLMTEKDLALIHGKMKEEVLRSGGRIDGIYHCPALESEGSVMRKPDIGMALKARKEFPGISFKRSVMVGDALSDMVFGRRLGMVTVFLSSDKKQILKGYRLVDHVYKDMLAFAGQFTPSAR
jgi:D-glycero-D-manno-heptose 1,7-bisphosphate phosphatase